MDAEVTHPAETFACVAREYCAWVERRTTRSSDERPEQVERREALVLLRRFSTLYAAGLALCEHTFTSSQDAAEAEASQGVVRATGRLDDLPFGFYWRPNSPLDISGDGECSLGDLCDDILDVWSDLRRGLLYWDAGRRDEAAWEWQWHFQIHWGAHVADALGVLHEWVRSQGDWS